MPLLSIDHSPDVITQSQSLRLNTNIIFSFQNKMASVGRKTGRETLTVSGQSHTPPVDKQGDTEP